MPSFDGNFARIGDPFEGFGMGVVIVEEAIDRGFQPPACGLIMAISEGLREVDCKTDSRP
jgi:hypothetical protein